jgi:hypothetical protein
MSLLNPPTELNPIFDGNQLLSQFVDWSAKTHEILYVVAGNQGNVAPNNIPSDNFNGMTIAYSVKVGATWSRVGSGNNYDKDADGDRTSISLLAPGYQYDVPIGGSNNRALPDPGFTSYAAPQVTGTAALLQQFADNQIMNVGAPRWTPGMPPNATRHEVMKAVLMNSADKLDDDGTHCAPVGCLLGMTRTILKKAQDGNPDLTWFDSPAYDDAFGSLGSFIPLDIEMGAGHLNAARALQQFMPGEFAPDGADVPLIGWDYGTTTGAADFNRYRFDTELVAGNFISITLAWDRVVEFETDVDMDGEYDIGDTFEEYVDDGVRPPDDDVINDLDIYLLPRGATSDLDSIGESVSPVGTLEHLFFQIPETGEYEFWVRQHDDDVGMTQDYGVAWWYGLAPALVVQGDYNGDGTVGPADYDFWRADFGETVAAGTGADGNGNGTIDAADYVIWRKAVDAGAGSIVNVPEPASFVLLIVACAAMGGRSRKPADSQLLIGTLNVRRCRVGGKSRERCSR